MINAVIFDLDGTLADTLPDLRRAMNEMLSEFGYPTRDRSEILSAICYGQREFVIRSLPEKEAADGELVDRCQKRYSECYAGCSGDETAVYEGMPEAIDALRSKGILTAVVTNKAQDHATFIMSKLYKEDAFVTVKGNDGSMPAKPDPTSALYAASLMGVQPSGCAFVGDSDIDIKTAINAGMHPVGVTWGYRDEQLLIGSGAEFTAHTPEELLRYLLSL